MFKLTCDCGNVVTLSNDGDNIVVQNGISRFQKKQPFMLYADHKGKINIRCNECDTRLGPDIS